MHQAPPTPPAQEAIADPQVQFLHSSPSAVHPMLEREREIFSKSTFKAFLAKKEVGIGSVLLPFRLSVTGVGAGPGMFDIAAFLGKEEVVQRIEIGLIAIDSIFNEA